MKLIDLLSVITEETKVNVWQDGEVVSTYDGKDSIDPKWNKKEVLRVSAGYYKIDVEI